MTEEKRADICCYVQLLQDLPLPRSKIPVGLFADASDSVEHYLLEAAKLTKQTLKSSMIHGDSDIGMHTWENDLALLADECH